MLVSPFRLAGVIGLAMVALLGLACLGCINSVPVPVGRAFYTAVDKPFRRYTAADGTLTDTEKAQRIEALDRFDKALKKAGDDSAN